MVKDRFLSLTEVAREKARLDELRSHHGQRMRAHLAAFKDKEVRGRLVRNSAMGMVGGWKPARVLSEILGSGTLTSALGAAAFVRGGIGKRLVTVAMGLLVPYLVKQAGSLNVETIIREAGSVLDRFRDHKGRKADPADEEDEAAEHEAHVRE